MNAQRWLSGRARWVTPGHVVDTGRLAVDVIERTTGRRFVEAHHYSGTYVASRLEEGPFRPFRHPGNHVYAWALDGVEEGLAPAQPRPRRPRAEQLDLGWAA
jgi:hypothetical protein